MSTNIYIYKNCIKDTSQQNNCYQCQNNSWKQQLQCTQKSYTYLLSSKSAVRIGITPITYSTQPPFPPPHPISPDYLVRHAVPTSQLQTVAAEVDSSDGFENTARAEQADAVDLEEVRHLYDSARVRISRMPACAFGRGRIWRGEKHTYSFVRDFSQKSLLTWSYGM